jgi:tRNA A37 methylthiotransferase MiaB
VHKRAQALRTAVATARSRYLAGRVGTDTDVLVEKSGRDGLDAQGVRVRLDGSHPRGALVRARIVGHDANSLIGASA